VPVRFVLFVEPEAVCVTDEEGRDGQRSGNAERATVVVDDGDTDHELSVPVGSNLREVLLEAEHSPYTRWTAHANCGGRGLCATCGVRLREDVDAEHWHDRLADRFGYPRLSCQITVTEDLVVELDREKRVWGRRE